MYEATLRRRSRPLAGSRPVLGKLGTHAGLTDRGALLRELQSRMGEGSRRDGDLVLLYVNLDHFKSLNALLGMTAGDRVIADVADRTGVVVDPHTAVGIGAARACGADPTVPTVAMATAHPAKFPDVVAEATGRRPELPPRLADLFEREERCTDLPSSVPDVKAFVEARARG